MYLGKYFKTTCEFENQPNQKSKMKPSNRSNRIQYSIDVGWKIKRDNKGPFVPCFQTDNTTNYFIVKHSISFDDKADFSSIFDSFLICRKPEKL